MLRRFGSAAAMFAVLLAAGPASAETAMDVVERALRTTQQVDDYTARVTVAIEAPNINIPRRIVKVYYKRPNQVHVDSDGLAVIPRDALLLGNLATYIRDYADASFVAEGEISGRTVDCIKLAPREPTSGSGRVLFWIDQEHPLLLKSEIWREGKRQLLIRFHYTQVDGYWMPRYIITDVEKGALPGTDGGAHLQLQFTDYRINTGLSDSIFEGGD